MPSSLLPREGLTTETLFAPIRLTLLQPVLTGPVLLLLHRFPEVIRRLRWLPPNTLRVLTSSPFVAGVSAFCALGLLRKASNWLSRLMLNNFTYDAEWNWSRELVLVTGGSSGIGALIVQEFAARNIKVIILDMAQPKETQRPNVHFYKADITSSDRLAELGRQIREDHGDPTVLINNAGIGYNLNILDETEDQLRRSFEVNTIAHFLLFKEFGPAMIKRNHGHVVTIASLASFFVYAQNVAYSCTKASALAFHEGMAQELKSRYNANKVRTTVVHPTWVRTPLIEKLSSREDFKDFVLDPGTVAEAVVKQVLSGYGAQLILPARFNLISMVRGFPSWLQEGMRNSAANDLKT